MLQQLASAARSAKGRGGGGGGGGGGRSGGGADAALTAAGWKAQLAGKAQEQAFAQEIQGKQEQARLDANQFDYEYSQKSKQKIARINQAMQTLQSSTDFTPGEKADGMRELQRQLMGITQDAMPADKNRWKGDPKKAPGLGNTWVDEEGNTMTTDENGIPKLVLQYRQSREYQESELKAAAAQAEKDQIAEQKAQAHSDWKDERNSNLEYLREKATNQVEVPGGEEGEDPVFRNVPLTPDEVKGFQNTWLKENPSPGQLEQQQQQLQLEMQQHQAKEQAAVQRWQQQQERAATQQQAEDELDAHIETLDVGDEFIGLDGSRMRKKAPKKDFTLGPFVSWRDRGKK
jgi:hypothetical protein